MNEFATSLGGAVTAVLVGGTLIARHLPARRGPGRHRAPRPATVRPAPDDRHESVEWQYCATEQRPMEHGAMPCGALVCLGCGRVTEVV